MSGHPIKSRKGVENFWREETQEGSVIRKKSRLLAESIVSRRQRGENRKAEFNLHGCRIRISIFLQANRSKKIGETRWRDNPFSKYRWFREGEKRETRTFEEETVPSLEWISAITVYCSPDLVNLRSRLRYRLISRSFLRRITKWQA